MTSNQIPRRVPPLLALGAAAAVWLSCADLGQAPVGLADSGVVIPGLIVSNSVPAGGLSSASPTNADDEVAYISLPPGALPGVLSVRLRNLTSQGPPTEPTPVFDGGFDPVAVAARAGHQLALLMSLEGGAVTVSYLTVPLRRPPRIVRTVPSKGRTDVALNTRPLIVFSEPIDAHTLSNTTIQLLVAGVALSGTAAPVPGDALLAEFSPAVPLAPNTAHELLITTGVRDLQGDALESSERITFTTQVEVAPAPVAYLTLSPPMLLPGEGFELAVSVFGNQGSVLTDRVVSWSSSDTSVARVAAFGAGTESARVFVTRAGTTTITASSEGRSASITLTSIDNIRNSSALEIVDISLIEFEYSTREGWFYAPQLRIRGPAGSTGVSVFGVKFTIPGIGTRACLTHAQAAAGQTTELFHEVYGDFDVTFDRPGARATSTQSSAVILVKGANDRVGYITVSVPIEPGSLPTTYSGINRFNEWAGC